MQALHQGGIGIAQRIVDPCSTSFVVDESRTPHDGQMTRDLALGHVEDIDNVADTQVTLAKQYKDPYAPGRRRP
jgi:hypothetical protein